MALRIVRSEDERLLGPAAMAATRSALAEHGAVNVFVPTRAQTLDAQRACASEKGLSLGVTCSPLDSWARERWGLYGDGSAFVDDASRVLAMRHVLDLAPQVQDGRIDGGRGTCTLLCRLAREALAWLPLDAGGGPSTLALDDLDLADAERAALEVVRDYGREIARRGLVEPCQALRELPGLLAGSQAPVPPSVLVGFPSLDHMHRALVVGLAGCSAVTFVEWAGTGPAFVCADALVAALEEACSEEGTSVDVSAEGPSALGRAPELQQLLGSLFRAGDEGVPMVAPTGACSLLEPAGPLAEAELVAREIARLAGGGASRIVVCAPDVSMAWRSLAPKLAARGISTRSHAQLDTPSFPAYRLFMGFAEEVARLSDLRASWPEPTPSQERPVPRLGDMSWWPPRPIIDFLLSDLSDVPSERVWALDRNWRGNRLLTPAGVLDTLGKGAETSALMASVMRDLLKGHVASAAGKLRRSLVERAGDGSDGNGAIPAPPASDFLWLAESASVLDSIAKAAAAIRDFGATGSVGADGAGGSAVIPPSLSEELPLVDMVASVLPVSVNPLVEVPRATCMVELMSSTQAASLPPCSVDALVYLGLDTVHAPVSPRESSLDSLLETLGAGDDTDPIASARDAFRHCVSAPRSNLVLERCVNDETSSPTYPAVMLTELLACYDYHFDGNETCPLPAASLGEEHTCENLSVSGEPPVPVPVAAPSPAGQIGEASRPMIIVPRDGTQSLPGEPPTLSASQVETYLECPYKWFSLRRLGLDTSDAGFGGMEMGTFAHRVLEVTHRTLLEEALGQETGGAAPGEGLSARHPGSRVDASTLPHACDVLNHEFETHLAHQYRGGRHRVDQALIPHRASEELRLEELRHDLLDTLAFESGILEGFEPRLFEQRFGGSTGIDGIYGGANFVGTIDRIDVDGHGRAVVIDYKHKSNLFSEYALFGTNDQGEFSLPRHVQALIYASVVKRALAGENIRVVGAIYLGTRGPAHVISGALDANASEQVFGSASGNLARVSVPGGGVGSFDDLLERSEDMIGDAIERMLAGEIEARPLEGACDWCPVTICERRLS